MTTDLHVVAQQTAAQLGDGWRGDLDPYDRTGFLCHLDGRRIDLSVNDERISAEGRLEHVGDSWRTVSTPQISVRADRGAKVLAAEITRRLLPAYQSARQQLQALAEKRAEADAQRATFAARLQALMPGSWIVQSADRQETTVHWRAPNGPGWARVKLWGNAHNAHLEMGSLPHATVEALSAALAAQASP